MHPHRGPSNIFYYITFSLYMFVFFAFTQEATLPRAEVAPVLLSDLVLSCSHQHLQLLMLQFRASVIICQGCEGSSHYVAIANSALCSVLR